MSGLGVTQDSTGNLPILRYFSFDKIEEYKRNPSYGSRKFGSVIRF